MIYMFTFYLPILVSLIVGVILVPLCIRMALALGIVDDPAHRKIHAKTTPYLGGIAVIGAIAIAVLVSCLYWSNLDADDFEKLLAISICTLAATFLGVLDDKFHIRPRYKLAGQLLIATSFALFAYRFELITLPTIVVDIHLLSLPLTIFWLVAIINAFNMIDGMDGLCASVGLAASSMLVTFAVICHDLPVALLGLAAFGSLVAFLLFNWSPARIFLGDAGSLGLGTLFATSLLAVGNQQLFGLPDLMEPSNEQPKVPFKIISVTLVVIYPAMEVLVSVLRRGLRGKPVTSADKGHFHHRLLARGWRPAWICLAVVVITMLAQGVVMAAIVHYMGLAAWLLGSFGVMLGLGMHYLGIFEVMNPFVVRYFRPHYQIANHLIAMQRLKLTLTRSGSQVFSLVNATCRELGVLRYSISYKALNSDTPIERDWHNPDVESPFLPDKQGIQIAAPEVGYSETIRLEEVGAVAHWTFQKVEREEELDVEYRVLMSAFMHETLIRLLQVPLDTSTEKRHKSAVLDIAVSATKLRESKPNQPLESHANPSPAKTVEEAVAPDIAPPKTNPSPIEG